MITITNPKSKERMDHIYDLKQELRCKPLISMFHWGNHWAERDSTFYWIEGWGLSWKEWTVFKIQDINLNTIRILARPEGDCEDKLQFAVNILERKYPLANITIEYDDRLR